jgi:hypothetical protein
MEIKVNERIPHWLTDLIAGHNLQRVGLSKYCRSIAAAQKLAATRPYSIRAECSRDVLASSLSTFRTLERKMGIASEHEIYNLEASRGPIQHH